MSIEKKEIVMAFFDILGSSHRINSGQLEEVYDFYEYMAKLCNEKTVPLSSPGVLPEERGTDSLFTSNEARFL